MSIAIAALLILVVVAIVAIPILIRVVGEAARRGPSEDADDTSGHDESRHSGPGRE